MKDNSKEMPYKYVFILGTPRSGTSLLYHMMVKKQGLVDGSDKESAFYSKIKKEEYSLSFYLDNNYYRSFLDKSEISKIFNASKTHIDFFKNAINYYLSKKNKKIFVEKTPAHTLYHKDIINDFDNCLIILLTRYPSAVINSMVKTVWINLLSDRLPPIFKENNLLKYLSAILKYYRYNREYRKISSRSNTLVVSYEDIVQEKIDLRKLLEEKLSIPLDKLYIPRPFSNEVDHRRYEFDESRIWGYKKTMPGWAQALVKFIIDPETKLQKTTSVIIKFIALEPVCYLWKFND